MSRCGGWCVHCKVGPPPRLATLEPSCSWLASWFCTSTPLRKPISYHRKSSSSGSALKCAASAYLLWSAPWPGRGPGCDNFRKAMLIQRTSTSSPRVASGGTSYPRWWLRATWWPTTMAWNQPCMTTKWCGQRSPGPCDQTHERGQAGGLPFSTALLSLPWTYFTAYSPKLLVMGSCVG